MSPQDFAGLAAGSGSDSERLEWKLSLILDTIETHVLILDDEMHIRRANRPLLEAFTITQEEIFGKHASILISNPTDQFVLQRLAEVLRSGQPETIIAPSSHRADRVIRYTMKPWPKGVALFSDDITEREKIRDRKIAENAVGAALDELGGVGFAHVQSNGTILDSSISLSHMVGSPSDALAGARLQSLFDPRSRTTVNEALKETGSSSLCYEVQYLRNGVNVTPAVISVTPYWTAEHHACAAVVLHDPNFSPPDCKVRDEAA